MFLIPNLCHDMHDCSIAEGDRWLEQHIDGYAQWARTHNSLLIVTFDESADDEDNHIVTLAVGQRVVPGPLTERADHYRLLRTLEDLYALPPLGHSAHASAMAYQCMIRHRHYPPLSVLTVGGRDVASMI